MADLELGQMLFSNARIEEHEVRSYVSGGLHELGERVARSRNDWQFGWGSLTSNSGADEYVNETFALRAYCWCEGEGDHEEECPPNFEHYSSGVKITWYKHANRGVRASQDLTRTAWKRILEDCLESIGFSEEQALEQERAESARCMVCKKSQEDLKAAAGFTASDEVQSLKFTGTCLECRNRQFQEYDDAIRQIEQEEGSL